jgi:hypothetical protein
VFCLVQTKFHHYILPAVPPLALLVRWFLDDLLAAASACTRCSPRSALGIVLLVCRDLMYEPERWIEMFVFRYDRPWPSAEPYEIDPRTASSRSASVAARSLVARHARWSRLGVALSGRRPRDLRLGAPGLHADRRHALGHARACAPTTSSARSTARSSRTSAIDQLREEWSRVGQTWSFRTFIPTTSSSASR